jgi:hypothetical protein
MNKPTSTTDGVWGFSPQQAATEFPLSIKPKEVFRLCEGGI